MSKPLIIFMWLYIAMIFAVYGDFGNSVHNFDPNNNDSCTPCHLSDENGNILNDLDIPIIDFGFQPYTSPTMDSTALQPRGISLLCLSCHDGVIAQGSYNLQRDHPISILYSEAEFDPKIINQSSISLPLNNGYLECFTCHDPHNQTVNRKLLRITTNRSELCLECHNK